MYCGSRHGSVLAFDGFGANGKVRTMVRSQAPVLLTISKLASEASVGVETVRFYQRRGLLPVPSRKTGTRRYGVDDVRRLRFIRQAQSAGFTLREIAELLALDAGKNRDRARELAQSRLKALNQTIAELENARESLRRLARSCAEGKEGPCPILQSFDSD
jgi:MerR family transcriptional regulator, mercuric resistance operon regulatory protein